MSDEADIDDGLRDERIETPDHVRDLTIVNQRGLHARASARMVKLVEQFDAQVEVSRDGQTVGGNSIMGLMMLAACTGSSIHVETAGPQSEEVMAAIVDLVEHGFGEID